MEALKLKPQKRVACLYRVSTKGQVDENDIPMQKKSCREFIKNKNWNLIAYSTGIDQSFRQFPITESAFIRSVVPGIIRSAIGAKRRWVCPETK